MARSLPRRLVILLVAAALLFPVAAGAQSSTVQVHINNVVGPQEIQTASGLPALSYEVDLTLLTPQQEIVSSVGVVTATMVLDPGGPYPAQVQQLTAPWTILVLIDASSTVAPYTAFNDFKSMRTQLAAAIGSLPDGYNISVEKFDTAPTTIQDFTNAKDKVTSVIQSNFQPTFGGNACLNDAVFDAINNLSRAPGRRALLVVTASLDGCGKPVDQALTLAEQNHIQIYAVGMLGYKVADAKNLEYLTLPTGGLAYAREVKDLKFALSSVSQALKLQWSAQSTLYPAAGPETATVRLTLSDQTLIDTPPLSFNVTKSFARPAQISLRGAVLSTKQGIRFGLDFVSPQLINQLKVNVTSKLTGDLVLQQTLSQIQATYDVPINNLTAASTYLLQINALDKTGAQVSQAAAEFTYQPPAAALNITKVVTPTQSAPYYAVQVATLNLDSAVKFRAWLQPDGQANQGNQINLTEVALGSPITISTSNLSQGVYDIGVAALDVSGNVLQTATSPPLPLYVPPSPLEVFLAYLQEHPILIGLMGGVGCLSMVVLLVGVVLILPRPRGQPKAVELFVPDVKRRPPPVNLEVSKSQPLPRQAAPPRDAPPQPVRREVRPPLSAAVDLPAGAPAGMPKACLSGYAPAGLRVATTITKASYTIGRRDGNDLVLPVDNKVGVSGRHATIKFVDGRFFLVDDRSTFGTFVNDQRLPAGATMALDDGAVIGFGPKVKIQFQLNCP